MTCSMSCSSSRASPKSSLAPPSSSLTSFDEMKQSLLKHLFLFWSVRRKNVEGTVRRSSFPFFLSSFFFFFLSVCKEGDKLIQTLLDLLVLVERQGSGGDLPLAGLQAKHLELHCVLDHEPRYRDSSRLANPVDPVNCLLLHYSPKKFHRWSSLLLLFLLLVWVEKQGNVSHQQDSTTGQAGSSCWQR